MLPDKGSTTQYAETGAKRFSTLSVLICSFCSFIFLGMGGWCFSYIRRAHYLSLRLLLHSVKYTHKHKKTSVRGGKISEPDPPAASPDSSRLSYCHLRSRGTNEQLLQNLKKKSVLTEWLWIIFWSYFNHCWNAVYLPSRKINKQPFLSIKGCLLFSYGPTRNQIKTEWWKNCT